jgi:RND family efflux transporter MFP subunit
MNIRTKISTSLAKLKENTFFSRIRSIPFLSRLPARTVWIILSALLLALTGGFAYYKYASRSSQTASQSSQQTAVVRRGDLVIYASGTGTLIASDQVDLAFKTGGPVKDINVAVGEHVEKGELLAEVDATDTQIAYQQARRSYLELTSVNAIATAEQAIATAQTDLDSAIGHLKYLISPDVYSWEQEVIKDEAKLEKAQAAATAAPSDEKAQKALKKAQATLDYAKASLVSAWASWEKKYVPDHFTVKSRDIWTHQVTKYVGKPTDADITEARAAVTAGQATVQEAKWLYATLTGGDVPENATGSGLVDLEQAKLDMDAAQVALDGTKIYSPISGTVMSIDTRVGDTASSGTTVITVADLSQPYLEVFLDESDWSNIKVNNEAQVTFDIQSDKTYTGTVTQVDPELYTENNSSMVRAIVKLENVDEKTFNLPLGTTAAVDVIGGQATNAILVPVDALHEISPGKYAVNVVENGVTRQQAVEIGIQDLLYAEIKSGLKAGEIVATGSQGAE